MCQSESAPVVINRGGRYDKLLAQCGDKDMSTGGAGFSFAIDDIRELAPGAIGSL